MFPALNIPAPFSFGQAFYTVITISPEESLYCVLHKQGSEKPKLWISRSEDDMLPGMNIRENNDRRICLSADAVSMLSRFFNLSPTPRTAYFGTFTERFIIEKHFSSTNVGSGTSIVNVPDTVYDLFQQMLDQANKLMNAPFVNVGLFDTVL